ncbi:MAG: protein kinase [Bryobacteraceae bacterium]
MELASGLKIGPYEILHQLGAGGMGEVWKARDSRLGREVAIKVLPAALAHDSDRLARFELEAKAASALNHPGILTIFDIGQQDGSVYLVCEFIEGQTLREARVEPLRKQIEIASQVADALAAAHAKGITHRDLKPDNIMVSRDGRAKILDFGLAKQAGPIGQEEATRVAFQSEPGTVVGTVGYMAPEQVRGQGADARSDIFSFGAVLYELLSGARAFGGEFTAEILNAIVKSDPAELPASVPASVRLIVERCLEKDPGDRFQSAKDLAFALRNSTAAGSGTKTETIAALPAASAPRRIPVGVVATAAVLGVVAGLVVQALRTPSYVDLASFRHVPFAIEGGQESDPAWSPDSQTLAYVADDPNGVLQVMVKGLKSATPLQLTKAKTNCRRPFWSPDGARVYYVSQRKLYSVGPAGGASEVLLDGVMDAVMASDGKTMAVRKINPTDTFQNRLLVGTLDALKPYQQAPFPERHFHHGMGFSPDGKTLYVFARPIGGEGNASLWLLPVGGGAPRRVALPTEMLWSQAVGPYLNTLAWLPGDRQVILSARLRGNPVFQLFLADLESGASRQISAGLAAHETPAVSRDGKHIAYVSGERDMDLMEISLDSGTHRPLLATSASEMRGTWPANGNMLLFESDGSGLNEIRVRNETEGWSRPVITRETEGLPADAEPHSPAISPDGQRLVYEVRGEDHTLWVSSMAGGRAVQVARMGKDHQHYANWSPDGNWIVYRSSGVSERLVKAPSGGGGSVVEIAGGASDCNYTHWSGDWILCVGATSRLYSADGKQVYPIRGGATTGFSKNGSAVISLRVEDGQWGIFSMDVKTRVERKLRDLDLPRNANVGGFSMHPDGKRIVTSMRKAHADIYLLEGFRTPARWWERLF